MYKIKTLEKKSFRQPSALAVISAVLVSLMLLAGSSASATGSKAGVGGGASVGDTLVSTAWEMYVEPYVVADDENEASPWGPEARDVYSYRIAKTSGTVVDFQATTGLTGLTAAEQSQWYVDADLGGPAYEFDWFVFGCSDAIIADSRQVAGDVVLNEVAYQDIEDAAGFPTFTNTQYTSWLGESVESRFSAYDSEPDARLTTNVQTSLESNPSPGIFYGNIGLLAASYLDFSCPAGLSLFIGEILQGPDGPAAVAKNLPIESVMSVEIDGTKVTVAMAGTYVGVTGRFYAGPNAALWGVTYINSTSSGSTTPIPAATATTLASTGAEVEWFAIGSLIAVVAGAGFFALGRRKRAW
jgi:LPXTG-motif cell wall-anchored protein